MHEGNTPCTFYDIKYMYTYIILDSQYRWIPYVQLLEFLSAAICVGIRRYVLVPSTHACARLLDGTVY